MELLGADGKPIEYKKCPLSMLCDLYGTNDAYERHRSSFLMNHDICTCNAIRPWSYLSWAIFFFRET